jgi:hypothetical protein
MQQLCGRLMPQVCLLLVDKSADVRQLALNVLTSCTAVVRAYHNDNKKPSTGIDDVAPPSALPSAAAAPSSSGGANGQPSSGWTTWAVDGFSKSIERVALNATANQPSSPHTEPSPAEAERAVSRRPQTQAPTQQPKQTKKPQTDAWGDDEDLDLDDDEDSSSSTPSAETQSKQWSDLPSKSQLSKATTTSSKKRQTALAQQTAPDFDDWDEEPPPSSLPKKSTKAKDPPAIKKMPAPSHSSFDDWDDSPTNKQSHVQLPKSAVTVSALDDEFDDWGDELDDIDLPPGEVAWGDEDDLDLDLNVLGNSSNDLLNSQSVKKTTVGGTGTRAPVPAPTRDTVVAQKVPTPTASAPPPARTTPVAPLSKAKATTSAKKEKETPSSAKKSSSKPVPVVKKLAVSSSETDNWDDF